MTYIKDNVQIIIFYRKIKSLLNFFFKFSNYNFLV